MKSPNIFPQEERFAVKDQLQTQVDNLFKNLTSMIQLSGTKSYDRKMALQLLANYTDSVVNRSKLPEEIEWDMLASQAFITSVQTSTG